VIVMKGEEETEVVKEVEAVEEETVVEDEGR
jgi:hypothetical protein